MKKATEVFTPGSFPKITYVERSSVGLEKLLRDAVSTHGQIISLSGPSKSGKTVLVEKVVGQDSLIPITGANIHHPDELWEHVLDWMEAPSTVSKTGTISGGVKAEAGAQGTVKVPLVASGQVSVSGAVEGSISREKASTFRRRGMAQVIDEIGNSNFVLLLDDFHYMSRDVQVEVSKILKEAVRLNVKICTASVRHRGDDVVRANPELRGRVKAIDLDYWKRKELAQIAELGFSALGVKISQKSVDALTTEAAGSPQLMQLMCLTTCFIFDIREECKSPVTIDIPADRLAQILEQTSANTDFRSLVDVLDAGPRMRGTERRMYKFNDGTEGDVYRCILKALAAEPPRLSFKLQELMDRVAKVCTSESPVGSSVVGTCFHMTRLAQEKFPSERAIDWDEQKQIFDIPDPYLLFYLRWSGRLREE